MLILSFNIIVKVKCLTLLINGPKTRALSTQRPVITISAPFSSAFAIGPALLNKEIEEEFML